MLQTVLRETGIDLDPGPQEREVILIQVVQKVNEVLQGKGFGPLLEFCQIPVLPLRPFDKRMVMKFFIIKEKSCDVIVDPFDDGPAGPFPF